MRTVHRLLPALLVAPFLARTPVLAQTIDVDSEAPIARLLESLPEDVREYHDHVSFLAHPFLEGRLPGTRGMEIAKDYCEQHLVDLDLEPVFEETGHRQPFELQPEREVVSAGLSVGDVALTEDLEFSVTGLGGGGAGRAPAVFCGYGIGDGPDGYEGFPEGTDLTGKVAVILRFEPMDEDGVSLWARRPPWSPKAGFRGKLRDLEELGAEAVVMINTPGAKDERVHTLMAAGGRGRAYCDVPVLMLLPEAGARLLEVGGVSSSLMELRREADDSGVVRDLGFEVSYEAVIEEHAVVAENVIGLLRGRGDLEEEILVLGAHLDHLGQGSFGSRGDSGKLHPGADDNASGSAGVLMIAKRLVEAYDGLGPDQDARSILFVLFSAEESGLIGSRYYCRNPAFPIERHVLMINFDMIGRMQDRRLSLSGAGTGEGLAEFLEPLVAASDLDVVQPDQMSGASDHLPFYRAGMPVLFGIIADFHDDYHTSRDTADKINRVDAVRAVDLFTEVLKAVALHPERFDHVPPSRDGRRRPERKPAASPAPVVLGVSARDASEGGVEIVDVTAEGSAAAAGLEKGDRLLAWNSKEVAHRAGLKDLLDGHEPGDKVQVTVERAGSEKVIWVTLRGR